MLLLVVLELQLVLLQLLGSKEGLVAGSLRRRWDGLARGGHGAELLVLLLLKVLLAVLLLHFMLLLHSLLLLLLVDLQLLLLQLLLQEVSLLQ